MDSLWGFLNTITPLQLGVGLAVTAALMTIILDWRLSLFALVIQFLLVSLLLNEALPGGLSTVKLFAGAVACLLFYWTARQIEDALGRMDDGQRWFFTNRELFPMGLPFRFLILVLTAVALFTVPQRLGVDFLTRIYLVPGSWLLALGLLTIILTRDPLKSGMGLLTFQNGFELLYHQYEPGFLILALLAIGTILVALVASYLELARHLPLIERRRAETDPGSPQALAEAVAVLEQRPTDPDATLLSERATS